MADDKKYYWLKLQKDFFKRHDIRIIEAMPNGKDYILFYLKLLVESVSHEGELRFSETIPYSDMMLATITDTNIDIVRAAMQAFTDLGMMEILEDATIYMTEIQKMIGSSSGDDHTRESTRERVRKHREKRYSNVTVTLQPSYSNVTCNGEIDIEKEKDLETDIEKEDIKGDKSPKHRYGEYKHVLLTDAERDKLINQFGNDGFSHMVRNLDEYIQMKGARYKDHYLTMLNWARRDDAKATNKAAVSDPILDTFKQIAKEG